MAWRQKPGHAFKTRVTDDVGRTVVLTTGMKDEESAALVEAMLERFNSQGADRYEIRRLLVAKRVPLPTVYYHYQRDTLSTLIKELATPDLDPLVDEWKAAGANEKYVKQVRSFIPKGERFPAARFSRGTISKHLSSLKVSGSTKNRYRAALYQFARWLVETEVLEFNPVRDVAMRTENGARELYFERADAIKLVKQQEQPYAAVEAFMANGMERGAVMRLRRKDVDLKALTVNAHGSKTKWRNRTIKITEAWTVPIIKAHLATLLPNALVFDGVRMDTALDRHVRLQKELDIRAVGATGEGLTTLHDWRHTYAVNSLRDGMRPEAVAKQLGHRDASMVHRNYGRFIVDDRDYVTTAKRKAK